MPCGLAPIDDTAYPTMPRQEIMLDPVVAPDGITYDRTSVQRWTQAHATSPVTGAPMAPGPLTSNAAVRDYVSAFLAAAASGTGT